MQPVTTDAVKKSPLKFLAFAIAALAMIVLIVNFLFKEKKPLPAVEQKTAQATTTANQRVMIIDKHLHASLQRLQELDEQAATLLADSTLALNSKKWVDSVTRLTENVIAEENYLSGNLTVLKTIKAEGSNDTDDTGPMISGFEKALSNHRYFRKIAAMAAASAQKNAGMRAAFADPGELKLKDARIKTLEAELDRMSNEKNTAAITTSNPSTGNNTDASLQLKNKSLLEDNDRLLNEIANNKRLLTNAESVAKEKQVDMNKKMRELSDELTLAQVDCNLSRADAKQIVYNSRQRKELLSEALAVLNNLSQSGSADIQQKVKAKVLQLQNISNAVRE